MRLVTFGWMRPPERTGITSQKRVFGGTKMHLLKALPHLAAVFASGLMVSSALATVGTYLPLDQWQSNIGTEVTNNTIVQNGGFETVDGLGEPVGWTKDGTFQAGTPVGGNSAHAAFGAKAAQGPLNTVITDDFGNPNRYYQIVNVTANTDYTLSAYMWNFSQNFDLTVVEALDPGTGNTVGNSSMTLTRQDNVTRSDADFDAANGAFGYTSFNSGALTQLRIEVEFDIATDIFSGGPHTVPFIAGQVDRVALTPSGQFMPIPEPASIGLLSLGGLALLRRRHA